MTPTSRASTSEEPLYHMTWDSPSYGISNVVINLYYVLVYIHIRVCIVAYLEYPPSLTCGEQQLLLALLALLKLSSTYHNSSI